MRVRLDIAYLGTRYIGWQRQPHGVSIQGVLESVLSRIYDQPIRLTGAGRTDTGVHAVGQVAHFDTQKSRPTPRTLTEILNKLLPLDIAVMRAKKVPETFNSRRNAKWRKYLYRILVSSIPDPFRAHFVWHYPKAGEAKIHQMRQAARAWIGKKDFGEFTIHRSEKKNTWRKMENIDIRQRKDEIWFTFTADAFMHRMVRRMVVFLLEAGFGSKDPKPKFAAPANGLCLMKIFYN